MKYFVAITVLVYLLLAVVQALPVSEDYEPFENVSQHPKSSLIKALSKHAAAVDDIIDKLSEFETDSLLSIDLMSSRISLSSSNSDTSKEMRSIHAFSTTLGRYVSVICETAELLRSLPSKLLIRLDTPHRVEIARHLAGEAEADMAVYMNKEEDAHLVHHHFDHDFLPRARGFLRQVQHDLEKMKDYKIFKDEQASNVIEDDYFFI